MPRTRQGSGPTAEGGPGAEIVRDPTGRVPKFSVRFAGIGVLLGLVFPLTAIALDAAFRGLPFSWAGIVELHRANPIHWIVDEAPLVLAVALGAALPQRRRVLLLAAGFERLARAKSSALERESVVRREAEEEATREALYFRELVKRSPLGMVALDSQGRVIGTNPAFVYSE